MKRILILLLALTSSLIANGQVLKSIGIKGGMSIASQNWDYSPESITMNTDSRNGFYCAASLEFLKSKYFSLTTDLGYCVKGSSEEIEFTSNDLPEGDGNHKTYDTKFNYVTLSPMLKARYETENLIPYALVGLRMDYQLSYKSDFDYQLFENDFNKTIWGANFGAGLEYNIKQFGIFVEGQYQYDFTKVLDITSGNAGLEVKNEAIVVCIGLKYNLSK
jgi:opacity protein-like surface antigen